MTLDDATQILGHDTVTKITSAIDTAFHRALASPDVQSQRALEIVLISSLASIIAAPETLQEAESRAELCARELNLVVVKMLRAQANSDDFELVQASLN